MYQQKDIKRERMHVKKEEIFFTKGKLLFKKNEFKKKGINKIKGQTKRK